jgi:hypothetical protein
MPVAAEAEEPMEAVVVAVPSTVAVRSAVVVVAAAARAQARSAPVGAAQRAPAPEAVDSTPVAAAVGAVRTVR